VNALREGEMGLIAGVLEAGRSAGMQTLDAALLELVQQGQLELVEARSRAHDQRAFAQ
jgi:Tfp pilus assembly pilus retraction ATPase PilT